MPKIILNIPNESLKEMDKIAKRENKTYSELVIEAVKLYLRKKVAKPILREYNYL